MFTTPGHIAPASEPNESERAALNHLAGVTRRMMRIVYFVFALVVVSAAVDERLFTVMGVAFRSEERRVGKECRSRW